MRFWLALSMVSALLACRAPQPVRVTAQPRPGCPSGAASVGTRAWNEANAQQLVAGYAPRLGDLVGLVMDHAGAPLADVEVALRRGSTPPGGDAGARARRTRADGTFKIDSIVASAYVLQFKKPGFGMQWHQYRGITAAVDSLCVYLRAAPPTKLEF